MWSTALSVLLVAYIPGALVFRLPIARREDRAGLAAEERLFWSIVISLALTSIVGLGLAAAGWYQFDRLLWIDGALSGTLAVVVRGRLRLPPTAPRPGWTAGVAAGLVTLAISIIFHVPPAEYVMGGKDPGTYMNEGIQIAQRGTLIYADPLVASIPPESLGLFMLEASRGRRAVRRDGATYHSRRFMGFYLLDPDQGTVLGQFPHLLPVWIAVGYGTNGLTGARYVVSLASILAIMAVYFCGGWLVGRCGRCLSSDG